MQYVRNGKMKRGKQSKDLLKLNSTDLVVHQAPVVRRLDNAIHRINRYSVDKS